MNFCVAPREIRKINKRGGGQNKLRGVSKDHEKINVPPPVYFEPESSEIVWPGKHPGLVAVPCDLRPGNLVTCFQARNKTGSTVYFKISI